MPLAWATTWYLYSCVRTGSCTEKIVPSLSLAHYVFINFSGIILHNSLVQQLNGEHTLTCFSNSNRHVSSSTRFSSLSLASLSAPVSLAACIREIFKLYFCHREAGSLRTNGSLNLIYVKEISSPSSVF